MFKIKEISDYNDKKYLQDKDRKTYKIMFEPIILQKFIVYITAISINIEYLKEKNLLNELSPNYLINNKDEAKVLIGRSDEIINLYKKTEDMLIFNKFHVNIEGVEDCLSTLYDKLFPIDCINEGMLTYVIKDEKKFFKFLDILKYMRCNSLPIDFCREIYILNKYNEMNKIDKVLYYFKFNELKDRYEESIKLDSDNSLYNKI